jgi:hypothetical protein
LLDSRKFLQGEKVAAAKTTEDSSAQPAAAPEHPTSAAPLLDLFSEQKA